MTGDKLTLGQVARALDVAEWKVRYLLKRKVIAEPARLGPFRAFEPADLPTIRAALVEAGYLLAEAVAADNS